VVECQRQAENLSDLDLSLSDPRLLGDAAQRGQQPGLTQMSRPPTEPGGVFEASGRVEAARRLAGYNQPMDNEKDSD